MAVTEKPYTVVSSSTTNYPFNFPYLKSTDVKVSINGTVTSAWTFHNATTVKLNSNPTVGDKIRIYRETDDSDLQSTFYAGSSIKASDLNDNFTQTLYVSQESNNKIDTAWTSGDETIDSTETWVSNDLKVGTTQAIDGRIDSKIDTSIFSIYRHTHDKPMYQIIKKSKKGIRNKPEFLINPDVLNHSEVNLN